MQTCNKIEREKKENGKVLQEMLLLLLEKAKSGKAKTKRPELEEGFTSSGGCQWVVVGQK